MNPLPQVINDWLINSNLDTGFGQFFIAISMFILINFIAWYFNTRSVVYLIMNLFTLGLLVALGLIPIWIIIMVFMMLFAFGLSIMFGGNKV